jgi:hypothetical protein
MERIPGKVRAGLRSLPLMFGKALGGIAAAAGFGMAVFIATRSPNVTSGSPVTALVIGVLGLLVFIACGRILAKRESPAPKLETATERRRTSALAWGLLLFLVLLFLGAIAVLGS